FCCSDGNIKLAHNPLPEILKTLLFSSTEESKLFRDCIRTINNQFAFTSLGVKCDNNLTRRDKGIYTFRIQGQMYHFLNDLEASQNLQLYFHDTENEITNRMKACPRLTESIIQKIMTVLKENPYAKFCRSLSELSNFDDYKIILRTFPKIDQRVYNKPESSQVAALWGTKVSAVAYNEVIDEFAELLMPYKRYYLTGAKVRHEVPLYQVGDYKYNWLINTRTYAEEYQESIPPQLPCLIDVHAFANIHKYADTENPRSKYTENKNRVTQLVNEETYTNTDKLIPMPEMTDVNTIADALASIRYVKICWISGKIKFDNDNRPLWATACQICRKNYNMPPNTPMKCRSCGEDSHVEARCRLPVTIQDKTGTIYAVIYGADAEQLVPYNGNQLYEADQQGHDLTQQIAASVAQHQVICFIKHSESTHHTIIKLYTGELMMVQGNITNPKSSAKEPSTSTPSKAADPIFFSPTLKNVLESIDVKTEKTLLLPTTESSAKKRITFDSEQVTTQTATSSTPQSSKSNVQAEHNPTTRTT
ncbi:replication protein A 70 kDa DNA-binding subunit B, partial [Striga asiatica]